MKKAWLAVILASVVAGAILIVSREAVKDDSTATKKEGSSPLVVVEVAKRQDISRAVDLTGSIVATKVARMASPAEGPIVHCEVREGDRVKRGAIVVRVGRRQAAEAAVAAARQELKKQAEELGRIRQLVENGAIAAEQLDAAEANYKKAEAQLAAAEVGTTDYEITAPWDGIVSKVSIAEGNYVAPRAELIEIFDPQSLALRFAVAEEDAARIQIGTPLQVSLDAFPGKSFEANISRLYGELDPTTRTRLVEAKLKDGPELAPGMFARVRLVLDTARDATVVPLSAILVQPGGEAIAFVVENGKAFRRNVVTGIEQEHEVQVLEGIAPGETVVVAGNEALKNDITVRLPKPKKPDERPDSGENR